MKALDASAMQSILDGDLTWRRKEISALLSPIPSAPLTLQNALLRAVIPLLYAHWEGFSRECFTRYLEFVSYRRLKFSSLHPAFLYLASSPSLSKISGMSVKDGVEAIRATVGRLGVTNKDHYRKRVITKSNLRSDVLEDLLSACGLDSSEFESDKDFIDNELCDPRNEIAHGGGGAPTFATLTQRRDRTFNLMVKVQTTVVNAAVTTHFKA